MLNAIGIHLGTDEVRAVLTDEEGSVIARSRTDNPSASPPEEITWKLMNPESVWETVIKCIGELLAARGVNKENTTCLCVSTSSGTVIPVGGDGAPLYQAIICADKTIEKETKLANEKLENLVRKQGYKFDDSSALSKVLWLRKERKNVYAETRKLITLSDFIVGKLSGEFSVTDSSNALKFGYDLVDERWPASFRELGLFQETFPGVVRTGEPVGKISQYASSETGLHRDTTIVAGTTDELACFASSGATMSGEWNSNLGDTLFVAGVSSKLIKDKLLRSYSFRHPDGYWLPAGKSSVGEECIRARFRKEEIAAIRYREKPSSLIVYPLDHQGEIFPFLNPEAQGFIIGKPEDSSDLYAGYLEGVGYIEKWIYDFFQELGFDVGDEIYVTGSDDINWLRIRANILEKVLVKSEEATPEMGAAIISASRTHFKSLHEAIKQMVQIKTQVEPDSPEPYQKKYRKFRHACRAIGYE